jgi:hypothetical protein
VFTHEKPCLPQASLLEQIFSLRPLDCKDSARAFPKREAREKRKVILGVSTIKNPYISARVVF